MSQDQSDRFWTTFLNAAETEYFGGGSLKGRSGLAHPVRAIGLDEKRHRLVVISDEPDARAAATAQADIQSALPSLHVVMARPLIADVSAWARIAADLMGGFLLTSADIDRWQESSKDLKSYSESRQDEGATAGSWIMERFGLREEDVSAFTNSFRGISSQIPISLASHIIQVVQQLSLLNLYSQDGNDEDFTLDLRQLASTDALALDRQFGVCGIPMWQLDDDAIEAANQADVEALREVLREMDVLQYFFPAPDQLLLGLADRGVEGPKQLIEKMLDTPELGHPFGNTEIVSGSGIEGAAAIKRLVEDLASKNLLMESEFGIELTETGQTVRATIRAKPREGLLSKLINRFSFNLDLSLSDLFRPSGEA